MAHVLSVGLIASAALVAVPAVTSQPAQAVTTNCTSTPFKSSSKYRYRVPAVVKTAAGRVFIFAEKRIANYDNDDDGNFDVVMRTSPDGGCTWTAERTIANDGNHRVSNPVPIYDARTDQVLLFTIVKTNRNYLHLQRISSDGTRNTPLSTGRVDIANWLPGLTGPGHGLVLSQGEHAGRVIFAMAYTQQGKRFTRGIYSDDNGATWQVGYDRPGAGKLQLIEGTIAELPSGKLLISYRDRGTGDKSVGRNRVSAVSTDGGQTVGGYAPMVGVKTVPVEGSLLQTTGPNSYLLFSSPSYTAGKLTSRRGMRLFVSTDEGQSWRRGVAVGAELDSACYSDLVQLDDDTVGIAYEYGYGSFWKSIVFRHVALAKVANSLLPAHAKAKSPTITGTARVGKTLTAAAGLWQPTPATVTYQWLRNGRTIDGKTASTYKLTRADRGRRISVRVTVSSSGFADTTATSGSRRVR
jgi:sialidase-1